MQTRASIGTAQSARIQSKVMGLPTFVRKWLKSRYLSTFSFTCPGMPTVCVYDLMQDLKFLPPDKNYTQVGEVIDYYVSKMKAILYKPNSTIRTLIVMVDRAPPPIKRLVTHGARYKNKDVLPTEGAPYLNSGKLPEGPWIRFAGNYQLLEREFYARLFNALMAIVPKPGQMLVLHGFPGYSEWATVHHQHAYSTTSNARGQMLRVHTWTIDELPLTEEREKQDSKLYERVFINEHVAPCEQLPQGMIIKQEWTEASNSISEADGAMFFYDHFFPHDNIIFMCNDGDVFRYALLYSFERLNGNNNTFRNCHYLRIPYKVKEGKEYFGTGAAPAYEYVDFNALYVAVNEDVAMRAAGLQNNVATLCFLMIMAASDFFKDHMKGIGKEKVVWSTFMSHLNLFTHMVQMSKGVVPDTREPRSVVLDEDLYVHFVNLCYKEKYVPKKQKPSYEEVELKCNSTAFAQKDVEYCMPDIDTKRVWCRRVEWNMEYELNTPRNKCPDPFRTVDGISYYGYEIKDDGEPTLAKCVSERNDVPLDEVFAQHLLRNRKRGGRPILSEDKKRKIIEEYDEEGAV